MKTNYTKKVIRGSTIAFIGILLAAFISYIFRIVMARNLPVADVGLFFGILSLISFFLILRTAGLNSSLAKFIPEFNVKKQYDKIKSLISFTFYAQLAISVIFVVILFILSDFLAEKYFKAEAASIVLKLLSLILVVDVFGNVLGKSFQGFQKITQFSLVEASRRFLILILALLFFTLGYNLLSPVFAYLIALPLVFIIFFPIFLKTFNFFKHKSKITISLAKKSLFFGIPTLFRAFSEQVVGYFDVLILIYFVSLEQVGIYNVILPTGMLFLFLARAVCLVMLPMGSEMWAKKQYAKLSDGISRLHKYMFVLMVPMALALISFTKIFINIFFGKNYFGGILALQIILIGVIFFAVAKINNSVLVSIGKSVTVAKIITITIITNVILNFILIPKFGINGAAIATSTCFVLSLIISNYHASKLIKLRIPWIDLLKIFISGIVFIGLVSFLKNILVMNIYVELIVILLISSLTYATLIFLFRALTFKEIKNIIKQTLS